MGILSWLLLGLVVGAAAKLLHPGRDPGGLLVTIALGMAGAFVGGYAGTLLGVGGVTGFDIRSLGLATAGAVLLLTALRVASRRF
ncbi:MAG: GlsB/YeaQ/YmgE family stress response membrane protein [Anaerolineae bacterium]